VDFYTSGGTRIPAVTEEQMREVDRIAVEEFDLGILQMMENAGRNLAEIVRHELRQKRGPVTVLAGSGGNGGGGICCARHLCNHGFEVLLALSKPSSELGFAASKQFQILSHSGFQLLDDNDLTDALKRSEVVIDALIGYSLSGAPYGRTAELIESCNRYARKIVSLDVPSGLNSTTGETPGVAIIPNISMTLALPKTGLGTVDGDLLLADIGIPVEVYKPLGLQIEPFFGGQYTIPLERK
jgi:NAD(P)H-hydrate epimerase